MAKLTSSNGTFRWNQPTDFLGYGKFFDRLVSPLADASLFNYLPLLTCQMR